MAYLNEEEQELLRQMLQRRGSSPRLDIAPVAGQPVTYEIEQAMRNLVAEYPKKQEAIEEAYTGETGSENTLAEALESARSSWWNSVLGAAGSYTNLYSQYPDVPSQGVSRLTGARDSIYNNYYGSGTEVINMATRDGALMPMGQKMMAGYQNFWDSFRAGNPISMDQALASAGARNLTSEGYGELWGQIWNRLLEIGNASTQSLSSFTGFENSVISGYQNLQQQQVDLTAQLSSQKEKDVEAVTEQFVEQRKSLQEQEQEIATKWEGLQPKYEQARHFGPRHFFKPKEDVSIAARGGTAPTEPRGGFLKRFMTQSSAPGTFATMLPRQRAAGSLLSRYA